jgi:hypothetical protein
MKKTLSAVHHRLRVSGYLACRVGGCPGSRRTQEESMRAFLVGLTAALLGLAAGRAVTGERKKGDVPAGWTWDFSAEKADLVPTGRNRYFILEPGHFRVLVRGKGQLRITVLEETKKVDGVLTRVVEEKETKGGKLVEVSRNYFAISKRTSSVFYFGEDVDNYKGGKVVDHKGSWRAGVKGARFGLVMPGTVLLGARYYHEVAPGQALDRAEIVDLGQTVTTPAGKFTNCLKVRESTPLEPDKKEYKYYAPGVGLVQDGELKLVKHGKTTKGEAR